MISNHIFVFIYNFSVFLGLLSLGLSLIIKFRSTDLNIVPPSLISFICIFFSYGFLNLLFYYNTSILVNLEIIVVVPVLANFFYLFMYYFWIRYLITQAKGVNVTGLNVALNISVIICSILWTLDAFYFLDSHSNVINLTGNMIATFSEIVLFILYMIFVIIVIKNLRGQTSLKRLRVFLLLQNIPLSIYFIYTILKDMRITFSNYPVDAWFSNNISMCAFFSLFVNILFVVFFSLNIRDRFMVINEFETIVHNKGSKIHEIASEYSLSQRETEVLNLIFEGKNNQEISDELFISTNTVKKHINALLKKMNLHNRVDIITKYR